MKLETKQNLNRIDRILVIRQIAVDSAEARVREAQREVARLGKLIDIEIGKIRQASEEFSQLRDTTGTRLLLTERFIQAGEIRIAKFSQATDKAEVVLEERRSVLMEATRERKTVEKLRERRLQQGVREEATMTQKIIDDTAVTRHARRLQR